MKILRYLIFFSILSGIFLVVYRQSNNKGLRRWWISFKLAVLIAAAAAGLIPTNTEAMEPAGPNDSSSIPIERVAKTSRGGFKPDDVQPEVTESFTEVTESFKSNTSLKKVTKRAFANQKVKNEYIRILKRINEGVEPINIGSKSSDLGNGITYVRGEHGRYIIKNDNGVKDVVGIAYRGSKKDMQTLAKETNKSYNVDIKSGGY